MTLLVFGLCAYVASGAVVVGTVDPPCGCRPELTTNMTWSLGPVKINGQDVGAVMLDRTTAKVQVGVILWWVREGDEGDASCRGAPTS